MATYMTRVLSFVLAGVMLSACSDAGTTDEDDTGSLAIRLSAVPSDAGCLEVAVSGSRSVTHRFNLDAPDATEFEVGLLPIGEISVGARAFSRACDAVRPSDAPSYALEKAVVAEILPAAVTAIELNLLRNGRAEFVAKFETPAACEPESKLTALTFNIRYDSGPTGNNAWNRSVNPRRERVISVLRDSQADFIGLQEVLANQADDLVAALTDYAFFGVARDDGVRAGEYSGIFYRLERFQLVEGGNFWLSETPELPGTVFPGSGSIRIATWVRLLDLRANRSFLFLNTHWDNVSQSSRVRSGELIRSRLPELAKGGPVVVTGDLNTNESNQAVLGLISGPPDDAPLLFDAYRLVHPTREPEELTFHNFNGAVSGQRIDFILHDDEFKAREASIVRTNFDGLYPSDHYPVSATLSWATDGAGTSCE